MPAPDKPPILKFSEELLGVFIRWGEESDLDSMEMAEAATVVVNSFCDAEAMEFEPDPEFLDKLKEEEEDNAN